MLFQVLDDKQHCVGIHLAQHGLIFDEIPEGLSKTWKYCGFLKDYPQIKYASLYCHGKSLTEVCPEELRPAWNNVISRFQAYQISLEEAKVCLRKNCFFDLVPILFLEEFCQIKNEITEYVFENYHKPDDYEYNLELTKVVETIKNQRLNLNFDNKKLSYKTRKQKIKLMNTQPYINYDVFGSKTGRLTTAKDSFPILTLSKDFRTIIEPNNDYFVELDYNAAELRTLLALLDKDQPQEDIHDWNLKNIYRNIGTREKAKQRIFAWLYNPESEDYLTGRAYDREKVKQKYWDAEKQMVTNKFGRAIKSDENHALNYIVQSTSSDMFLRKMIDIAKLLEDRKSYIAFSLHDSLVIDFAEEDKPILKQAVENFSSTALDDFKVNVSIGKNFGKMSKINLK